MEIWALIVKSNTFNFAIFLLIIILIAKKVDINKILENMQEKVKQFVNDSKLAKEASIVELKNAETSVRNVGIEIGEILKNAEETAEKLGNRILEDAKLQSENILVNTEKMIESEGKKIISSLSQKTALASVELAKKHIVETLKNKPQYHANFINSSIDELDRLKF